MLIEMSFSFLAASKYWNTSAFAYKQIMDHACFVGFFFLDYMCAYGLLSE